MARWSSGQDGGLSRRNQEFDSPTGHQLRRAMLHSAFAKGRQKLRIRKALLPLPAKWQAFSRRRGDALANDNFIWYTALYIRRYGLKKAVRREKRSRRSPSWSAALIQSFLCLLSFSKESKLVSITVRVHLFPFRTQ